MTWTRVILEIDIDGEATTATPHAGDLGARIFDDERVIALSVRAEHEHHDDCGGDPHTCRCGT